MTDDEDRTRVVSPNLIPRGGVMTAADDDDEDPTAVLGRAERAQVMQAIASAKAPLDFDLTGASSEAPEQVHSTLDFDLTGGDEAVDTAVDGALDLDLSTGETSIPVIAAAAAGAAVAPRPATPSVVKVSAPAVAAPATSGGIGKWIVIALVIIAAMLATVYLRK